MVTFDSDLEPEKEENKVNSPMDTENKGQNHKERKKMRIVNINKGERYEQRQR